MPVSAYTIAGWCLIGALLAAGLLVVIGGLIVWRVGRVL
jgi:hypothetical protein